MSSLIRCGRNEWSGLTEWEWTHVDVFDSMQDKTVNPSISITRLKQSKKVVARNEIAVSDSLNETAALQSRSEKEQNLVVQRKWTFIECRGMS